MVKMVFSLFGMSLTFFCASTSLLVDFVLSNECSSSRFSFLNANKMMQNTTTAPINPEMHATKVRIWCGEPSIVARATEIKRKYSKTINLIFHTDFHSKCLEMVKEHDLISFEMIKPNLNWVELFQRYTVNLQLQAIRNLRSITSHTYMRNLYCLFIFEAYTPNIVTRLSALQFLPSEFWFKVKCKV